VDSGTVVALLVKEGESLAKGQGVIEIETGKAVAPVPAAAAGKVTKVLVAIGEKISVGQPLVSLEAGSEATASPSAAAAPATRRITPRLPATQAIAIPAPLLDEPELTAADLPSEEEETPGSHPPPA